MKSTDGSVTAKVRGRIRLGGILTLLGLAAYGGMFVSFGITDEDIFEIIGGLGLIVAAIGIFLVISGFAQNR